METRILPPTTIVLLIASLLIMYMLMRVLFKNSVLFKIGISTATVIILASFISGIQVKLGPVHNLWSFPLQVMLAIAAYSYISGKVKRPLMELKVLVEKISHGSLNIGVSDEILSKDDELGQIGRGIMQIRKGLNEKAVFAQKIGEDELNVSLQKLSDEDSLGDALLQMQESLKKARTEELQRKEQDDRRNWITEGQTKFAQILRQNEAELEALSFHIISNLVKYMKINQGGIFMLNDDNNDKHLEMLACYAFDRRKYINKRIEPGEGMLGTCFLEGKTTYLTQLPQDYIRITSGLGDENPGSLLLVPLKLNDEVLGVIELASFHPFEKHAIEFAEKIAEIIASAISGLKVSTRTTMLLQKSQQQAEELRAQEEEMRQNMEELTATQEALEEKERESYKRMKKMEKLNRMLADEVTSLKENQKAFG